VIDLRREEQNAFDSTTVDSESVSRELREDD
jgi:hypothetical protein